MATLCSRATGNLTAAATWGLVDSTSLANTQTTYSAPPTSAGASARSQSFTPGAITIDGIAIKLAIRTGSPTGTLTVNLYDETGGADVSGTSVTIDIADIAAGVDSSDRGGGWYLFSFSSVTLSGGTSYSVQAVQSASNQAYLWRSSTANDWVRFLRTTTTQAPVAGDDMIVSGEVTGQGTGNDLTVTMNQTSATDYGSGATDLNAGQALAVCNRGTLTYGASAATNYVLRLSGHAAVYGGGTLNIGTTGTPIPRDSTAVLEFDCAADGDFGLNILHGACNIQGLSRTSGKNVVSCKLNTDEAVASTSLGVDTDTGWLDNDEIAVASTTRTYSQCESGTLNGNAGASSLTVDGFGGAGGGLAYAHSGTSPTQAEVILITRNVKVRSVSSTAVAYVACKDYAEVDFDWAEFYYMGKDSDRYGISIDTTNGSFSAEYCSIHDFEDGGFYIQSSVPTNITISYCVSFNAPTAGTNGAIYAATNTKGSSFVVTNNILMYSPYILANGFYFAELPTTFTNNTAIGFRQKGFDCSGVVGSMTGVAHSNGSYGVSTGSIADSDEVLVVSVDCWRNNSYGMNISPNGPGVRVENCDLFGNNTNNIYAASQGRLFLDGVNSNGDSSFSTTNGINIIATDINLEIDNCDFSSVSGILTAHTTDVNNGATYNGTIDIRDTALGGGTAVNDGTLTSYSAIRVTRYDQTNGDHRTWLRNGLLQSDSTIFNTASPSLKMTPSSATYKLESAQKSRGIQIPVASGQTLTVSVYTRKSVVGDGAAYNGNQPRLIVRKNAAAGIDADTVLDTHSVAAGSWEQLSGTTAAVQDDGVLEFIVDCDGTAGWVNIDDWSTP